MDIQNQECPDPVFILGAPRSGTTALAWSLAQHSSLWTSGESYILWELFGHQRGRTGLETIFQTAEVLATGSWLTAEDVGREELLRYLGVGVNALFASRSRGKRWIDHTPVQTLMMDLLGTMFPGAMFLHVLRDGRKVVNSMIHFHDALEENVRANFARAGWTIPWTDFTVACKTWREYVEAALAFGERHPERCLTVRHDHLVVDPESCLQEVCDFIQVSYEESLTHYVRNHQLHSSFRSGPGEERGAKSLVSEPSNQWSADQKATFAREAGPTLVRCGLATAAELQEQML